METLLDVANLFVQSIDYQIKVDLNKGDEEGATLKEMTKQRVQAVIDKNPIIDDGRPCDMDVFAAFLVDDCDDHYDFRDAVNEWNHGDWSKALAYLSKTSRDQIAAMKK